MNSQNIEPFGMIGLDEDGMYVGMSNVTRYSVAPQVYILFNALRVPSEPTGKGEERYKKLLD